MPGLHVFLRRLSVVVCRHVQSEQAGCWRELTDWENKAFEEALANGHNEVQYVFRGPARSSDDIPQMVTPYVINLDTRIQVNAHTGTKRRLLRVEKPSSSE